jgi:transcriptional regulator with XRE-family HTH domain
MRKDSSQRSKLGFPERLRQLRVQKNLSQGDLAKLVGLHQNHIGRYERGDSQPTASKITKLAEVLGVSGDYLLDSSTDDLAKSKISDFELLSLFSETEKLEKEDKEVVKKLISAFINQRKIHELSKA